MVSSEKKVPPVCLDPDCRQMGKPLLSLGAFMEHLRDRADEPWKYEADE
jgi:hypothetical protein